MWFPPALGLTLPLVLSLSALTPVLGERTAQQIVSDANRLLSEGSYQEAARAYGEAIELDPSSYVNYYKRATVYLSLGRHSQAIDDFDHIIRLNPAFVQAHYQKARVLAKEGRFDEAQAELKTYGKSKKDAEAEELADAIMQAGLAAGHARQTSKKKQWQGCVEHATRALETGPNSVEMREIRVECATQLGDVEAAYGDLTRLATLNPSTISLPLRLSHIAYFLLGSETAMSHIKQCLHYDPDSKPCKKVHKLFRSMDKELAKARNFVEGGTWRQAMKIFDGEDGLLAKFEKALEDASSEQDGMVYLAPQFEPRKRSQRRLEIYGLACKAAVGANDFKKDKGAKWCDIALEMDEGNVDGLIGRGEKLLKEEKWDEAVRVFEKAFEASGRSSQDIANRLQRAQRLLKVSKQKDYYKVLGVPRDADDRQIKKALQVYVDWTEGGCELTRSRTRAKTVHPDVGGTEEQMAALNEAYEVLSDEGLRRRYDNGDDPNDPSGGHGGNPFAHHGGGQQFFFQQGGGFPGFGGGGGQKMHFHF